MCVSANRVCVMSVCVKRALARFSNDNDGAILAFTLTVFMLMVMAVGMAVDLMRHETSRAELQNAVDRGVLAAASMTQTMQGEETVRAYVKSTNFVPDDYDLTVVPSTTADGFTQLTATASYDLPTYFLKLAGITTLPVIARGAAIEGVSAIELSLVLDVSTSMSYETTGGTTASRLSVMKTSAKAFVDQILTSNNVGTTTISLVPFAGQVNPGAVAFDQYRSSVVQTYSNCIEFTDGDYQTLTAPSFQSRAQDQYFNFSKPWNQKNGVTFPEVGWGWCPGGDEEEIIYHSDNAAILKTAIDDLNTHEATGTQYGVKWGAMLLDPSSNALTGKLVTAGDVASEYAGLPVAHGQAKSKKFLVIMSDGNTTPQYRLNADKYDTAAERQNWTTNLSSNQGADFNFNYLDRTEARSRVLEQCQAAKDAGIIVFTIGFDIEVGSDAYTDMSACATSSSHFYDVDGLQLNDAFSSVSQTIQKLKLIN